MKGTKRAYWAHQAMLNDDAARRIWKALEDTTSELDRGYFLRLWGEYRGRAERYRQLWVESEVQ